MTITVTRRPRHASAPAEGDDVSTDPATSATSIVDTFWANVDRLGQATALRWRDGDRWRPISWRDYGEHVRRTCAGLLSLGLERGDRVAIMSNNRWEWHVADVAIMSAGCATVPIYQTSSSSQVSYMVSHAQCRVCIVENTEQLAKVLLRRHELPTLERVFLFEHSDGLDDSFIGEFDDLADLGDDLLARHDDAVDKRRATIQKNDVATLVYTSGTTGPPKATMLTHGNIMASLRNITAVVHIDEHDRFLSFLPLSHIAERVTSDFGEIISGGETWFAKSLSSVPEDITACRPTVFFAVPRVWEKFHEAIVDGLATQPAPLRALAERYVAEPDAPDTSVARRVEHRLEHGALDATIGRKIRAQLGLDKTRFFVSGAAPIAPDLLRWFSRLGIDIAEVYGQTEGTGVTTLNPPGAIRLGTVGPPVPGVELRIADDDEVLARGASVTPGYFDAPDDTRELLDAEGWMHTGDLGSVDDHGYLTIIGRKKDLIITSSGKNISPQEIETRLRYEPLISQAVVVGDNHPYLVALLTLDADAVAEWATERGKLLDIEGLLADPELSAEIEASVERANAQHARVEGVKKWRVLPHDFTIAENELTPTLKVKRQVVTRRYADLINQLYAGSDQPDRGPTVSTDAP